MSLNIDIDDDYCITSDQYNIILSRKYVVKAGKNAGQTGLQQIGFCPSVRALVVGLANKKIMESQAETLQQIADEIDGLSVRIELAFKA